MNVQTSFAGTWPAIVTPFGPDGQVDLGSLVEIATWMQDAEVDGFLAMGTVGEGVALNRVEREGVLEALADIGPAGRRVLVGVAGKSTSHACQLAEEAAGSGAYGLMCLPPTAEHASDAKVKEHYRAIASTSGLPIQVYNHPEISHTDLSAELIAELAEVPGITSLKECDPDSRKILRVLELTKGSLQISVGGDDTALALFAAGATGWLPGTANIFPSACVNLTLAASSGDLDRLRDIFNALLPVMRLDAHDDCASLLKAGMRAAGREGGTVRPPRTLNSQHVMTAQKAVTEALGRLKASEALRRDRDSDDLSLPDAQPGRRET